MEESKFWSMRTTLGQLGLFLDQFVCFNCLFHLFEINKNLLSLNAELLPEPDVLLVEVADLLHCEDGEQAGEQDQDDRAKKNNKKMTRCTTR